MSSRSPLLAQLGSVLLLVLSAVMVVSCTATPGSEPSAPATSGEATLLPAAEGQTGYPLTLTSPYGESVITQRPTRVASASHGAFL